MTTTAELLFEVQSALRDSAVLEAAFPGFSVYLGVDQRNPPDQSNYPMIAIVDVRQNQKNPGNRRSWTVELGMVVVNDTVDDTDPREVAYAGFTQVEAFRELVESTLIAAKIGKVIFSGESEKLSDYPVFISGTTMQVEKIINRREGI